MDFEDFDWRSQLVLGGGFGVEASGDPDGPESNSGVDERMEGSGKRSTT